MKNKEIKSIDKEPSTIKRGLNSISLVFLLGSIAMLFVLVFSYTDIIELHFIGVSVDINDLMILGLSMSTMAFITKTPANEELINSLIRIFNLIKDSKGKDSNLSAPYRYKLLKLSELLFSDKTQKEIFLQIMADWNEEIYETLKDKKESSLFMINSRNTYTFILAMWMKTPIGDLIEFIRKFAK